MPVDTTKKELNVNIHTKFDKRPLTLRHPKEQAIFRISSVIFNEFGNFLTDNGFTRICSPKIVKTGAEGGANIFKLDYFGRDAFLGQSPQFYKQMMVGVFGRVFEEAPVFRAEKHDTSRHLNEYISLDIEMMLENGFMDLIQVETKLLKHIFEKLMPSRYIRAIVGGGIIVVLTFGLKTFDYHESIVITQFHYTKKSLS